jgi:hypothetical protein
VLAAPQSHWQNHRPCSLHRTQACLPYPKDMKHEPVMAAQPQRIHSRPHPPPPIAYSSAGLSVYPDDIFRSRRARDQHYGSAEETKAELLDRSPDKGPALRSGGHQGIDSVLQASRCNAQALYEGEGWWVVGDRVGAWVVPASAVSMAVRSATLTLS